MKITSFQKAIQLQFDTLTHKVIDCTVKDYEREISRRAKRELTFSDLSETEINCIGNTDGYFSDFTAFKVLDEIVHVSDDKLCDSLKCLSKRKRDIILMYYFLDMTDEEISNFLQIARSTATRNRANALNEIKRLIKEMKQDEINN
jgi:DNA-directed RNA polymerase specialized sigma24 family protein